MNADDQGSSSISSPLSHVDKDPLVEYMQSVYSKPMEFIDEPPTLESILDDCRMTFTLPKYDRRWDDMDETEQFNYITNIHKSSKRLSILMRKSILLETMVILCGMKEMWILVSRGILICLALSPHTVKMAEQEKSHLVECLKKAMRGKLLS